MPSHYNTKGKKKMNQPKKKMNEPKNKMNVVMKLVEHSKSHSKEHMKKMRESMRKGKSFEEAHKIAMKSVGK